MMQEVEVLKTIQELICSFFSEEQFTLSRMFWHIDRTFEMTYTKLSDRSVETCEAYRRGRACGSLPLLV